MSRRAWSRKPNEAVAVDELLDAAGAAFADLGVAKATMVDVSLYAGCSRATLYRYFPNQAALRLAFVNRATLRIAAGMADGDLDPGLSVDAAMTDRILAGIEAVRADPLLAVWFEPENMAVPMALSQDSDLLRAMSAVRIGEISPEPPSQAEAEVRAGWLLRSIVSLLALPGRDPEEERVIVESFIVPVLVGSTALTGSIR